MKIEIHEIPFSYVKDNGVWVIHTQELLWKGQFAIKETSLINLPSSSAGGNHKHPRVEAFIAGGKGLVLYWQDESGSIHKETLDHAENAKVVVVPSFMPHAVLNTTDHDVTLFELASEKQSGVEPVVLV